MRNVNREQKKISIITRWIFGMVWINKLNFDWTLLNAKKNKALWMVERRPIVFYWMIGIGRNVLEHGWRHLRQLWLWAVDYILCFSFGGDAKKNLNVHSNDPNTGTRAIIRSLMDRSTRRQYSQCYLTNWFYITNHQWLTQHLLPLGRNQNWQKNEMVRWREWEKPTPNLWRRLHGFLLRPVQIVFNVIPHLPKLTNQ